MAGFRMHVGTSAVLGCGYAGAAHLVYQVHLDTAIVAGAMCGFSGMLPDIDSDYGVPLRETMCFSAAIIPMLLVSHFETFGWSHDAMALAAISIYLFIRFAVANLIRKYTVHRGMFHSIPTGLIFAGLAFLLTSTSPFEIRCLKAGGVLAGFMSHLVLDEIYAIEWKGGRWRFKKSFGTAIKFWGDDGWSNLTTYAKLAIVGMFIVGEPSVINHLQETNPQFAARVSDVRNRLTAMGTSPAPQSALERVRQAAEPIVNSLQQSLQNSGVPGQPPSYTNSAPQGPSAWPGPLQPLQFPPQASGQTAPNSGPPAYALPPSQPWPAREIDTAQRRPSPFPQ
jgi:hypothetical protein